MDGVVLFVVGFVVVLLAILLVGWLRRTSVTVVSPQATQPPMVQQPNAELASSARSLVAQGNTIEAIKLVRERTGMGLKEAKDYVDALKRATTTPFVATSDAPPSANLEAEARTLLVGGNKIAAIKRVRELTGWGLKEAKDYVDTL